MITDKLKDNHDLSNTEQKIADFILLHLDEISYLSISDLAAQTFSSNAAIIRLCRKCGCEGFRDFKVKLIHEIETSQNPSVDTNLPFREGDPISKIHRNMFDLQQMAGQTVYHEVDYRKIYEAADRLNRDEHIFLWASVIPCSA